MSSQILGCPRKKKTPVLQQMEYQQTNAESMPPHLCLPFGISWPQPYRDDTETYNSGISIATWSLRKLFIHLEKVASPPISKHLTEKSEFSP